MVKVNRKTDASAPVWKTYFPIIALIAIMLVLVPRLFDDHGPLAKSLEPNNADASEPVLSSVSVSQREKDEFNNNNNQENKYQCPYGSIDDLTEEERNPVAGIRHMVDPPKDGPLHLVCCQTTKGVFNTLVHEKWAPLGAQRFLDTVHNHYYDSTVPLMRCVHGFICQFGLNSDPVQSKLYRKSIEDDPNWLPEGPDHRKNEDNVFRFAHGYMAYAGGGKHTRGNQFIIALRANQYLAGGSPWEVPWGEIVGPHSFETWSKIYTGYGEKGPPQGKLGNRGMDAELKKEFPELDYITGCNVVDTRGVV